MTTRHARLVKHRCEIGANDTPLECFAIQSRGNSARDIPNWINRKLRPTNRIHPWLLRRRNKKSGRSVKTGLIVKNRMESGHPLHRVGRLSRAVLAQTAHRARGKREQEQCTGDVGGRLGHRHQVYVIDKCMLARTIRPLECDVAD